MVQNEEERVLKAQDARYKALARRMGNDRIALFCICAVYDVPYVQGIDAPDWITYRNTAVKGGKKRASADDLKCFGDGETDVRNVLRSTLDDGERWILEWGHGSDDAPYSDADYRRLDELFSTLSSRIDRTGGMDAVQDDTLHVCAKMRLQADKAIVTGTKESVAIAHTLNKMIQDNLAAEQLRKKDTAKSDEITIPGVVEALKRQYGLSVEMTREDVMKAIAKWMTGHHYSMTMDAAEAMLLAIINTTRRNNDEPELDALPKAARFDEAMCSEFEDEAPDGEPEAFEYLGIERTGRGGRYYGGKKR